MNCFYHENKPAIVACAKCGVGLCRDCMNEAVYKIDGKPLCLQCSRSIAEEELNDAQKERGWSLTKCLFSGTCLGIALIALMNGADIMQIWMIAGIAGLPTAFKNSHRTREQRIMDEIEDRYTNDVMELMFKWMFRLVFKLIFIVGLAPLCAIVTFIKNLVRYLKSGSQIKSAQETLNYIDRCLYGEPQAQEELPAPANAPALPTQEANTPQPESPYLEAYKAAAARMQAPNATQQDETQTPAMPPQTQSQQPQQPQTHAPAKKKTGMVAGIAAAAVIIIGGIAGYFSWYVPYAKDRDALRTYVVATNVFLRSSQVAGVEYNVVNKLPYGSELITYNIAGEWAEVKSNGTTGYVAAAYLLDQTDFNLLHGAWGNMDARDCIVSSKCRLAILDYYKSHALNSGSAGWQIFTKQKDQKPNAVFYPRLYNKSSKFTDFVFLVKNNATGERKLACYSFEDETERPIFRFDAAAPAEGYIRNVQNSYAGARIVFDSGTELNINF